MADRNNRLQRAFGITTDEHGDAQWHPESTAELEVLCLGLLRTGTTSIRAALDMLGLGPVHHGIVGATPFHGLSCLQTSFPAVQARC